MGLNACYWVHFFEMRVSPHLVLPQVGLRLIVANDFPGAFGINGYVALTDPTIELELILRRV